MHSLVTLKLVMMFHEFRLEDSDFFLFLKLSFEMDGEFLLIVKVVSNKNSHFNPNTASSAPNIGT